jgi:hypothetical protein
MSTWFVYCKDGGRTGWLAGPYDSKETADVAVKPAMRLATDVDPMATFYERGVARLTVEDARKVAPVFGVVGGEA